MILDLAQFDKLMVEPFMQLPLYWDGKNLIDTLNTKLYPLYLKKVKTIVSEDDFSEIDYICKKITEALDNYYRGLIIVIAIGSSRLNGNIKRLAQRS